jgi:hypothetical protein
MAMTFQELQQVVEQQQQLIQMQQQTLEGLKQEIETLQRLYLELQKQVAALTSKATSSGLATPSPVVPRPPAERATVAREPPSRLPSGRIPPPLPSVTQNTDPIASPTKTSPRVRLPHLESPVQRDERSDSEVPNRAKRIAEILNTERDYVRDLCVIKKIFLDPLQSNGILSKQDIQLLFSNLDSIIEVNRNILARFEQRLKEAGSLVNMEVGDIFLDVADKLKVYRDYCANQPNTFTLVERWKETNPEFASFLEQCDRTPECRGLDLLSFLIKPVQRLCKYPLLLRELIRDTDEQHDEWKTLTAALHKLSGIVDYVNEMQKSAQNAQARMIQRLVEIENSIETEKNEDLDLAVPTRQLVKDGNMDILKGKSTHTRRVYLFTDLILICAAKGKKSDKYSLKHKFFLKDIAVIDVADVEGTNIVNAFEIKHKKTDESITFCCGDIETKREWTRELKARIKDFQLQQVIRAKKMMENPRTLSSPNLPHPVSRTNHMPTQSLDDSKRPQPNSNRMPSASVSVDDSRARLLQPLLPEGHPFAPRPYITNRPSFNNGTRPSPTSPRSVQKLSEKSGLPL